MPKGKGRGVVQPLVRVPCLRGGPLPHRKLFPRTGPLISNRALVKVLSEDPGAWWVTCFAVDGRRVGSALLRAAVDLARNHGATAVENHPVDVAARVGGSANFTGTMAMFSAAGFVEVARTYPARPAALIPDRSPNRQAGQALLAPWGGPLRRTDISSETCPPGVERSSPFSCPRRARRKDRSLDCPSIAPRSNTRGAEMANRRLAKSRVGVLGSGDVGRCLAAGFASRGHDVMIGSRDPEKLELREWLSGDGAGTKAGSFAQAAAYGELLVLALLGNAAEEAIADAGRDNFSGKVVIDAMNPLDFSRGFPPKLSITGEDSLGERVQRAVPDARVVKAFNTIGNPYFVDPNFSQGQPTMLIAGNDEGAKNTVRDVLGDFGWSDVLDIGGIEGSR